MSASSGGSERGGLPLPGGVPRPRLGVDRAVHLPGEDAPRQGGQGAQRGAPGARPPRLGEPEKCKLTKMIQFYAKVEN